MKRQTFKVLIDDKPNTLTLVYTSKAPSFQYNTENNHSAHTFGYTLDRLPKNTPIKTGGHTYIILN